MTHFNDFLNTQEWDYAPHVINIETLLSQKSFLNAPIDIIEECFPTWAKKRSFCSLQSMKESAGISRIIDIARDPKEALKLEDFLYYLEYVLSILDIPSENALSSYVIVDYNVKPIRDLIFQTIDDLGYKIVGANGYYIVHQDAWLELASQATGSTYNLDSDMLLYIHPSLRSNLTKKADILCRMYKFLESKFSYIKEYGHHSIYSDISKLMDGLDIRHAPSKKERELLDGMEITELIGWYDQLFKMCVSLIILLDFSSHRREVRALKNKLG